MNKKVRTGMIAAVWVLVWQLAAWMMDQPIVLVGPADVCRALAEQIWQQEFWVTVLNSSIRICGGFLAAFLAGILAGITAGRFRLFAEFLEPAVTVLQSVPVASFVILALLWIGSENLSVLISFFVVFPIIYRNTLQGMAAPSSEFLEMAQVYRLGAGKKFCYIYWPALFPYVSAGAKTAFAMAWKSGVAAEVIGVPASSIGEKLYLAKIYLSTAELFAWTLVLILVSKLLESVFLRIFALLDIRRRRG